MDASILRQQLQKSRRNLLKSQQRQEELSSEDSENYLDEVERQSYGGYESESEAEGEDEGEYEYEDRDGVGEEDEEALNAAFEEELDHDRYLLRSLSDADVDEALGESKNKKNDSFTLLSPEVIDQSKTNAEDQSRNQRPKFDSWVLAPPKTEEGNLVEVSYVHDNVERYRVDNTPKKTPVKGAFSEKLSEVPVAASREALEMLGKLFLTLKTQTVEWLEKFDVTVENENSRGVPSSDAIYEALKRGDKLCYIANEMWFGECIKDYEKDFSSVAMAPHHERSNIVKFLKACHQHFHVPKSLLFEVGDLHNRQNIPKVVLSLRAVAKYAEMYENIPEECVWPADHVNINDASEYEEDDILMASSEMSKIDLDTIKSMYQVLSDEQLQSELDMQPAEGESASFDKKQSIVGNALRKGLKSRQQSSKLLMELSEENTSSDDLGENAVEIDERFSPVKDWLESLGVSSYLSLFIDDGWDDMDTVMEMTERDLVQIGIAKRGHVRKLWCAINRLRKTRGRGKQEMYENSTLRREPSIHEQSSASSKEWRVREGFPVDVQDAKSIWTLVRELQIKLGRSEFTDKDSARALEILGNLVEKEARLLVPFNNPVVVDIGWNTIKFGFLDAEEPKYIPTVVAKRKLGRATFIYGDDVRLDNLEEVDVRKPMHRGRHSIKEPIVIHWDDIERLLLYVLRDVLKILVANHPIFIIEPPQVSGIRAHRERLVDLLVNKFGAPAVFLSPASPLAAYSCGLESCIVLDVGESRSTASAIFKGQVVDGSVVHSPVAGEQLTQFLMQQLVKDGLDFGSVYLAKSADGYLNPTAYSQYQLASTIKDKLCTVALDTEKAQAAANSGTINKVIYSEDLPPDLAYALNSVTGNDGHISIGSSVHIVCEALFEPLALRQEQFYKSGSLQHIVEECLQRCPEHLRKSIGDRVILVGGCANFPGIKRRLEQEIKHNCKVISPKLPRATAWQGAAMIARQQEFQMKWVTKAEIQKKKWNIPINGPLPLTSPDKNLFFANKALAAMHYLCSLLQHHDHIHSASATKDSRRRQQRSGHGPGSPRGSPRSSPKHGSIKPRGHNRKPSDEATIQTAQPFDIKKNLDTLVGILRKESCSERVILDVKLFLSGHFAKNPPGKHETIVSMVHSLPANLKTAIHPYQKAILSQIEPMESDGSPASTTSSQVFAFTI